MQNFSEMGVLKYMNLKIKESEVQRQILIYLEYSKNLVPIFWRQNAGAIKTENRYIKLGKAGVSDIIGILWDGRFLAIEVKTPQRRKNVSPAQEEFLNGVNKAGGVGFVATDINDVKDKLNELKKRSLK